MTYDQRHPFVHLKYRKALVFYEFILRINTLLLVTPSEHSDRGSCVDVLVAFCVGF